MSSQLVIIRIYKFITHGFCSFFCDGLMFCYNVTFFELPLLTSVFWIGLGGSLERPSHSIDLAEMRRYCIMYYQQSYVLILSHEMALIPFTYLNFNLCFNDSLIISCVRFKVSRSCLICIQIMSTDRHAEIFSF